MVGPQRVGVAATPSGFAAGILSRRNRTSFAAWTPRASGHPGQSRDLFLHGRISPSSTSPQISLIPIRNRDFSGVLRAERANVTRVNPDSESGLWYLPPSTSSNCHSDLTSALKCPGASAPRSRLGSGCARLGFRISDFASLGVCDSDSGGGPSKSS